MHFPDYYIHYLKQKYIFSDFTFMFILKNKLGEQTKQKQIHMYIEQTDACQIEVGGRE